MSRQANTKLIGAFVLGAVALVVVALYYFGAGSFLRETIPCVAYFEGSVMGLQVGAPVTFRGVRIGSVTEVNVRIREDFNVSIPVYMEIVSGTVSKAPGLDREISQIKEGEDIKKMAPVLIEHGLRAQLKMQSFVTNLLYVELDFIPESPVNLVGGNGDYVEIPTVPTRLQELAQTVGQLPLEEIVNKILLSIQGIERVVNAPEMEGSLKALKSTLQSLDNLANTIDRQVEPLASDFQQTLAEVRQLVQTADGRVADLADSIGATAESTQELVAGMDKSVASVSRNLQVTLEQAREALQEADKTLSALGATVPDGSTSRYQLNRILRDLASAAQSLRVMADYLERNPEAIIRGKR